MGRTKRRRTKRKNSERSPSKDTESTTINLTKWLNQNEWQNHTRLQLRDFPGTGRGVTSSKRIKENDILITIPYDLMITYNTLQKKLQEVISLQTQGLKMHDLLALFLMIEKQKETSFWKPYIDSLPSEVPTMPWLATSYEITSYPPDLQIMAEKNLGNFTESMSRVKQSIRDPDRCVFDENLFKWCYILVNTRAVYVDPQISLVNSGSLGKYLLDEPSMALCPYLDMFNHHYLADTKAEVVEEGGKLVYQLRTLRAIEKFDQIFISYGSHDNSTLLMEYGFFIPGNTLDVVPINIDNILFVLNTSLDRRRYQFLAQHNFTTDLYMNYSGVSFNLKAVLFVIFMEDCQNYNSVIFGDVYPRNFLRRIPKWTSKMLDYKMNNNDAYYDLLNIFDIVKTENAKLVISYLEYRKINMNDLKNKIGT